MFFSDVNKNSLAMFSYGGDSSRDDFLLDRSGIDCCGIFCGEGGDRDGGFDGRIVYMDRYLLHLMSVYFRF